VGVADVARGVRRRRLSTAASSRLAVGWRSRRARGTTAAVDGGGVEVGGRLAVEEGTRDDGVIGRDGGDGRTAANDDDEGDPGEMAIDLSPGAYIGQPV
jgi:hypothetical protein